MNTDARRSASAAYIAKRKAEGWAKVTVWLSPEAQARLVALVAVHGSRDAALNAMLSAPPVVMDKFPAAAAIKPGPPKRIKSAESAGARNWDGSLIEPRKPYQKGAKK